MTKLFLFTFLLSFQLNSAECIPNDSTGLCVPAINLSIREVNQQANSILKVVPSDINCSNEENLRIVIKEYKSYFPEKNKKQHIISSNNDSSLDFFIPKNKIKLKATKTEIELLKKIIPSNTKIVELANSGNCKTVVCILTKHFANKEIAIRSMTIMKENEVLLEIDKFKNLNNDWKVQDIRDIQKALRFLPKKYKKLNNLNRFIRVPEGHGLAGHPRAAAWTIQKYKSWLTTKGGYIRVTVDLAFKGRNRILKTLVHELAHQVDFEGFETNPSLLLSESLGFNNLSNWKETEVHTVNNKGEPIVSKKWTSDKNACFITDYAGTEPIEEFAESFAYYVTSPLKLKNKCPRTYNFLKKYLFSGREYLSTKNLTPKIEKSIMTNCLSQNLTHLTTFHKVANLKNDDIISVSSEAFNLNSKQCQLALITNFPVPCHKRYPTEVKKEFAVVFEKLNKSVEMDLLEALKSFDKQSLKKTCGEYCTPYQLAPEIIKIFRQKERYQKISPDILNSIVVGNISDLILAGF